MKLRLSILALIFTCTASSVLAQDFVTGPRPARTALAPADEYFGHYQLSVLGIANTIRDTSKRFDDSSIGPVSLINGPLSFVGDAIGAWERKYRSDPWIAKDLLALELVYLKSNTREGLRLARNTAKWLTNDYPDSEYAEVAEREIAQATGSGENMSGSYDPAAAWARFASLRAPLPPGGPH